MPASSFFSVQLLSKIGAPLVRAIDMVSSVNKSEAEAAETMAKMLALTVEASISLHEKLGVTENEEQADATRMALAALIAPLIGGFYERHEKLPTGEDKEKIVKLLQTVLTFSKKYSPASEHVSRLSTIGEGQVLFDAGQSKLVVIQSMVDVMNAISEFNFGQKETQLIQGIAEQLEKDAAVLAKENGISDKLSELMIFKSLALVYATCHRAAGKKLSDSQGGILPIDPVWAAYETRVAMMSALISGEDEAPAPQETVVQTPVASVAEKPVVAPPPSAPVSTAATGGPMGFFAKKKEGQEVARTPPAEPEPVAQITAPPPAPTVPPVEKHIESSIDMSEDELLPKDQPPPAEPEKPVGMPGSPMSFFKAPPKKEEGEE